MRYATLRSAVIRGLAQAGYTAEQIAGLDIEDVPPFAGHHQPGAAPKPLPCDLIALLHDLMYALPDRLEGVTDEEALLLTWDGRRLSVNDVRKEVTRAAAVA